GFDNNVAASSNYRRIQRFIAEVELPMKWISQLIFSLLPQKDSLVLVLDRTNWKLGDKNINILMLGVSYKNVAFPLMFKMLDKRANSHTSERIALIQDFIDSEIKPIKIKKHGNRAISVFKYGADYLSRKLLTNCNNMNINCLKFLSCT